MVNKLKPILALFALAFVAAFPSSGRFNVSTGPCDLVTCAEAYSVTRQMVASYSGPLFQLNNGSSTLDIGQKNHRADMTTWSAFCSGVASNCTISKVYAQIHTSSNDLTPFNAGTAHQSTFAIEAATGLPIWNSANTQNSSSGGQSYAIGGASDNSSTGINAFGTAETVLLNVAPVEQPNGWCCGHFGTTHIFNVCCTGGTDFEVIAGWGSVLNGTACTTKHTWCTGADLECCYTPGTLTDGGDYTLVPFPGTVLAMTYDPVPNKMGMYVNGVQLTYQIPSCNASATPSCTMNSGQRVHFGGGGDLGGPLVVSAREMLITNSALTQAQVTNITNNTKSFYAGVNFPSGVTHPATYAAGPGDVATGATYFNGLRAYTAAIAAAGTQALITTKNLTSGNTCDILTNAAGGLGNTTNCSNPAQNGQSIVSFCSTIGSGGVNGTPGGNCGIVKVFDQASNVANMVNTSNANQAIYVPNCINFNPCGVFQGGQALGVAITASAVSQPYSMVAVANRSDSTAANVIFSSETSPTVQAFVSYQNVANTAFIATNTGNTFPAIFATPADNAFHSFYGIFNGASSSIVVDGNSTSGTLGPDASGPNETIGWGKNQSGDIQFLDGGIAETGLYPFALTPTQETNLLANQRVYWGF